MRNALAILERVAPSDLTVIISGEPGSGKEWAARRIHGLSPRSNLPFHAVDCGALAEEQAEKELFGYESLSWDGVDVRKSAFEEAGAGTLFLQDLDALSDATQLRLARAIEYRQFRRMGGDQLHALGSRIIVGTQSHGGSPRTRGSHRDAFASRATAIAIQIPPLRRRRQDIPMLIQRIILELTDRYGNPVRGISPEATALCSSYAWPGNVRQLKNALEYASVMCGGGVIGIEHLPDYLSRNPGRTTGVSPHEHSKGTPANPETTVTRGTHRHLR